MPLYKGVILYIYYLIKNNKNTIKSMTDMVKGL